MGSVCGSETAGISYSGGEFFWFDELFFSENSGISAVGVFNLSCDFDSAYSIFFSKEKVLK